MSTKPVNTRATTAARAGCGQREMSHKTPFSGRGSRNPAEDPRHNILQLNTEGLTADKISVIEQLAYQNKASYRRPTASYRRTTSSYRRPTAQLQTS